MCKFPLTSCLQIICKIFFANLTTESQRILKTNTESNRQANFYIDAKKNLKTLTVVPSVGNIFFHLNFCHGHVTGSCLFLYSLLFYEG